MQLERVRGTGESLHIYDGWMKEEGIPVYESLGGVDDVAELPRQPWARMGGSGTFVRMLGTTQAERGTYVAEIPGGGALNPERHMYDEAIYILEGRGLTEIWQEGGAKVTFEWGAGSIFAPPMNTWHRLVNGSREPVLLLGLTTAPRMMNTVHNTEFVFNCDYIFNDRFSGKSDFFTPGERRRINDRRTIWETNFIPDARSELLDRSEMKVLGGEGVGYRMGQYFPNGHITTWPNGIYHKAHYHGPGAILLGLGGKGYCLLWDHNLGVHPYQDGYEDQVIQVNWGPRSIYTPPDGWFHQHFSTGKEQARLWAIYGSADRPEVTYAERMVKGELPVIRSVRDGGQMLEYEDEDPQVRRHFEEELKEEGVECTMPEVVYRQ